MRRNTIALILAIIVNLAFAGDPDHGKIKIAVIDTGKPDYTDAPVCAIGHADFSNTTIRDTNGHATHVADVIDQYAKNKIRKSVTEPIVSTAGMNKNLNYCLVFIKYWNPNATGIVNARNSIAAMKHALQLKVDIINYSGGGPDYMHEEREVVLKILNKKITLVAAIGNEGQNLDLPNHSYYPAQYDPRIVVVGSLTKNTITGEETKSYFSNKSKDIDFWEVGSAVVGRSPSGGLMYLSGTSQATAIKTGKIINALLQKKKK